MHAFLITGGSTEDRKKQEEMLYRSWNVHTFDIFRIQRAEDKLSLGIDDVRLLTQSLSLSPRQSPMVVGIIDQAQSLTEEAQHALLKTLEEPPGKTQIILEANDASALLATIVSRCQIIHLPPPLSIAPDERKKILDIMHAFEGKRAGDICHLVDGQFDKKEEGVRFFSTLLCLLHEELLNPHSLEWKDKQFPWTTNRIKYVIQAAIVAQNKLSANVNHLLVLDAFFFTISLYKPHSLVYNKSIQ